MGCLTRLGGLLFRGVLFFRGEGSLTPPLIRILDRVGDPARRSSFGIYPFAFILLLFPFHPSSFSSQPPPAQALVVAPLRIEVAAIEFDMLMRNSGITQALG